MTRARKLELRSGGAATWAWLALFVAAAGCSELKVYRGDAAVDAADAAPADAGDVGLDAAPGDTGDASVDASEAASEDAGDAMPDADADDAAGAEDADAGEADAAEAGCDGAEALCGGACVDLSASVAHCGRCDNACPARANAAATCVMGACGAACNAGFADCDGDASNGCEASLESAAHCGRCGARCEGVTPLCGMEGGARRCVNGCAAGEALCGGACAATASSEVHCGRCDNACPTGATCVMGACACPSGQRDCGGACAATGGDCTAGRGACARTGTVICAAMGAGTQCSARPGAAGAETCNGVDDDCDGAVDGAAAAAACPARANATATCAMGACGYACAAGFGDCDGDAGNGCENPGPCTPCAEGWRPIADGPAVQFARCAWTGSELLVWGGHDGSGAVATGSRYDPRSNRWTPMAPAPLTGRYHHSAAWTGAEFIVWGGELRNGVAAGDGAIYRPAQDRWELMSSEGAPGARQSTTAAWAGTRFVVWGGGAPTASSPQRDGASYNLTTRRWQALPLGDAPSARQGASGLWTGTELLVWGGTYLASGYVVLNDGARFDPAAQRWVALPSPMTLEPRGHVIAAWTGAGAFYWGGMDRVGTPFGNGELYDPRGDRWMPVSAVAAPPPRGQTEAVWTGAEVIFYGGSASAPGGYLDDGFAYSPAMNRWRRLPSGPLGRRAQLCAVWTGGEVLIHGGADRDGAGMTVWSSGARYTPPDQVYPRMSCSGRCVDVSADPLHCGACGNECAPPTNATATCARSRCAFVCNAGFADCDGSAANGCEVDLRASREHCGACRSACAGGEVCASATCVVMRSGRQTYVATRTARLQLDASLGDIGGWREIRSHGVASYADDGARGVGSHGYRDGSGLQGYSIQRLAFLFPSVTGLPPGARVVGARIEILATAGWDNVPAQIFRVVSFSPASPPALSATDYAIARWGVETLGEEPNANFRPGVRHGIELNARGIAALSTTAPNIFGWRSHWDIDDVAPPNGTRLNEHGGSLEISPIGRTAPEDATLVVDWQYP